MDKMNDLKALLRHCVQELYSAEEQIIESMPAMITKAQNPALKQALEQHLRVTENQRERIDQVRQMLGADEESVTKYSGILSNLFGAGSKCKGMEGLIDEGQKMMAENLSPVVMDAVIVAGNQKIEHYEIAAYGTARTYAQQLGLTQVAQLLQQTLDEEYRADEILTALAVSDINQNAEAGAGLSEANAISSSTNVVL
ncbi:MAG: Stress response diiron-containing protein YciF [uncultured Segetibacter sp.]|uniref:Stress response diiron-containing protein YciF n=1 Tax=uncultured Segetibacter sp. TaxID=481133 RepID=A0A6J4SDM1_9BACT|nr:MAG: Stress response diiron-containing protein YciF [uncultured Segetibacter sp.]